MKGTMILYRGLSLKLFHLSLNNGIRQYKAAAAENTMRLTIVEGIIDNWDPG